MSIIIQNITDVPTSVGSNKYQLRINSTVIAEFYHNREDGLAACLRKAAIAAEDPARLEVQHRNEVLEALLSRDSSV